MKVRAAARAAATACLLATLGACADSAPSATSDASPSSEGPDGYNAEVMCEEFVKDRLASPGSAEFSDQKHTEQAAQTWRVTGVVDSQSRAGVLVRADYACTMRHLGEDEWSGRKVSITRR